jgi:hypothetical protein
MSLSLESLLADQSAPSKAYAQLLAEGVQHAGGLSQLAAAERADVLFCAQPALTSRRFDETSG